MNNFLSQGSNWLNNQRHNFLTSTVTYKRTNLSVDLRASIGKTIFRIDSSYGISEHFESRDYIIRSQDLILEGVEVVPLRGDIIDETKDGITYSYEVMVPGNEPHYRRLDRHHDTLRIHTKLIDHVEST